MGIRPIFLRPIEITSSNKDFKFGTNAGGANPQSIPTGTYAHIGTLCDAIQTLLAAEIGGTTVAFNSTTFKITISSGTLFDFEATDTDLFALLGFDADVSGRTVTTATYTPSHLWFPARTQATQDFFTFDHNETVHGVTAHDGKFHGVSTGGARRTMSFVFEKEPAANVADEFGVNVSQVNGAGTTYYWDEERNFDTFTLGAATARPTTYTNATPSGFWYYRDFTDVAVADTETVGGVRFNLGTSPDDHVYCHLFGRMREHQASLRNGRLYYDVQFQARTATLDSGML